MMSNSQWSTSTRVIATVLLILFLLFLLVQIQPLFGPLILAALTAYTLNLFVRPLARRTRLSRRWSANLVYLLFVLVLLAMPGTLVPVAVVQTREASAQLQAIEEGIADFVQTPLIVLGLEVPLEEIWNDLADMSPNLGSTAEGALSLLESTSTSLLRLLIVLVTGYYLLVDWSGLQDWLLRLLPPAGRPDFRRLIGEIDSVWRAYLQGTLLLMLIMGIVFIVIGLAIGLPGAIPIGLFTGLLSMIPELGPTLAGIVAALVALIVGSTHLPIPNIWFALLVAGIYIVVMQIKSIWLRPHVMGRFMRMNTGLVFLAIIAAVMLQGILAAFLVLPLLATVGVIGRYVRARLLQLDPWPVPAAASSTTSTPSAGETESHAPPDETASDSSLQSA